MTAASLFEATPFESDTSAPVYTELARSWDDIRAVALADLRAQVKLNLRRDRVEAYRLIHAHIGWSS